MDLKLSSTSVKKIQYLASKGACYVVDMIEEDKTIPNHAKSTYKELVLMVLGISSAKLTVDNLVEDGFTKEQAVVMVIENFTKNLCTNVTSEESTSVSVKIFKKGK